MAATRRVAALAGMLVLAGTGACKESLFDETIGGDDTVGDDDDVPLCPGTCLGDPVDEFSGTAQGGTSLHWHYRSDGRAENGADYADMQKGSPLSGITGWLSSGTPPAGIASCNDAPGAAACAGLADYLLFVPTQQGAGLRDPVLSYTAPADGVYRLTGQYRVADGAAAGIPQKLLVSRNTRNDLLFKGSFTPSVTPGMFDVEVDAVAGDRLLVETLPNATGAPTPLGVRFYASEAEAAFPGQCGYAGTFDGADPTAQLRDRCVGSPWTDHGTLSVPSASPELGTARQINYGTHLQGTGGVIDRSGDFTIQFWFKDLPVPNGELVRPESIYADEECSAGGGMWLTVYDDGGPANWDFAWMYHDPQIDWCQASLEHLSWTQPVEYENWHFYRITRSTADETIRICVDGKQVAMQSLPGSLNLTGIDPPYLGMGNNFGAEDTSGIIDDFRAFKRALPCSAAP